MNFYNGNTETHKVCGRCNEFKGREEFYKDSSRKDNTSSYCKPCMKLKNNFWRKNNPEKINKSSIWYRRKISYGLSKDSFFKMLEIQKNCCAICSDTIDEKCHVDHDHKTGAVRGLLCRTCNTGIGMLKDSPDILLRASQYLR